MKRFVNPSDRWVHDLLELGWYQRSPAVWVSPSGFFIRGPFKAWCLATGRGWPPKMEKEKEKL